MISAYGYSEMGFVFCGDLGLSADVRSRTVGRPLPFVECRVVTGDASSGDALGTLQIRYRYRSEGYVDFGGSALGYDGTLVDDGWYSSADLARPGPDGTVEVIGRQEARPGAVRGETARRARESGSPVRRAGADPRRGGAAAPA